MGEVGYEALYWLPFLDALRARLQIDPARVIPISRGGAAIWYNVPRGLELYAMRPPQQVRVQNWIQFQQTGWMKQQRVSDFDRGIYQDAAATLGLKKYLTLHPAWMYQTLTPGWNGERGPAWLQQRVRFQSIPAPVVNGLTLPDRFVAVRFYFRPTFPASPQAASFAKATIAHIAKHTHVIILNSGLHVDDHFDYLPKDRENVTVLSEVVPLTAENNLAVQSAVLGKATGFVGTYGGMCQLALRMGVPSVSFYNEWHSTAIAHRHLSETLALQMGIPFLVHKIGDLALLQSITPTVVIE